MANGDPGGSLPAPRQGVACEGQQKRLQDTTDTPVSNVGKPPNRLGLGGACRDYGMVRLRERSLEVNEVND